MHALHDLRLPIRRLSKTPGFSLTVILTLTLGIGATTAVFSLVEGILLRPLPYRDPDKLVMLGDHLEGSPGISVTAREIGIYANGTRAFASIGGYTDASYELSGGVAPERVDVGRFTAGVFPTLGVSPILGRVFTPQEEGARSPVAILSYALWQKRYHGDAAVVGSALVLDRQPYTVVGVMPRGFDFPPGYGLLDQTQLWMPMSLTTDELSDEHAGYWGYHIIARLKDGVSLAQAGDDTERVARQIKKGLPVAQSAINLEGAVAPLLERVVGDVRPVLRAFFLAACTVLLIACANVAALLLVRAIGRRNDFAVRLALGAGRGVLVRESVWEGLLLGAAGGVLGLGFAALVVRATLHLLPDSMPRVDSIAVDRNVATFALVLALATGAMCSLAPAFASFRANLTESLKDGHGRSRADHAWLRSGLVVSEIAVALVLVNVSGAFLRSLQKTLAVDPGFRADHVLVAGYQLPLQQYSTQASVDSFHRQITEGLSNKPGVIAAGITNELPASGLVGGSAYTIEGEPAASWKLKFGMFSSTSGDYFRAMGIPLIEGRYFTAEDSAKRIPVMIVNQSMAKQCWPGQDALGKRMHVGSPQNAKPWATIVGVVADTKMGSRDEPTTEQWYTPLEQPSTLHGAQFNGKLTDAVSGYITLRSALPPGQMTKTLRATVREIDPMLALQQVQTMGDVMSSTEAPRRFNTDLITAFAFGALLLAITGIYSVMAFSVAHRNHEIAIRMAVGAQRSDIARVVLGSGVKLGLLGCAIGITGSLAASRLVVSFLFEVSATDPMIYAASVLVMMTVVLLASAIPTSHAVAIDPMRVLRAE